jgi:hypothetical protein
LYYFTICSKADNALNDDEGFIQKNRESGKIFVLGRLNDIDLEGLEGPSKIFSILIKNI